MRADRTDDFLRVVVVVAAVAAVRRKDRPARICPGRNRRSPLLFLIRISLLLLLGRLFGGLPSSQVHHRPHQAVHSRERDVAMHSRVHGRDARESHARRSATGFLLFLLLRFVTISRRCDLVGQACKQFPRFFVCLRLRRRRRHLRLCLSLGAAALLVVL